MSSLVSAARSYAAVDKTFRDSGPFLAKAKLHPQDPVSKAYSVFSSGINFSQGKLPNPDERYFKDITVDGRTIFNHQNYADEDVVRALGEPAPFGKGNKTILDPNVRKALEIKAERIEIDYYSYQTLTD
jgi:hypothetical protein